jgi:hypothetical protein
MSDYQFLFIKPSFAEPKPSFATIDVTFYAYWFTGLGSADIDSSRISVFYF